MSQLKWILILAVMLLINNILLLKFIGYFDGQADQAADQTQQTILPGASSTTSSLALDQESNKKDSAPKRTSQPPIKVTSEDGSIDTRELQRLVQSSVKDLMLSQEFGEVVMKQQMESWQDAREKQKELKNYTGQQALDAYLESESIMERQTLLQTIVNEKLDELDSYGLISLFNDLDASNDDVGLWYRGKVVTHLMEQDDSQGLQLAKSLLQSADANTYLSHEFYEELFRLDPEFVTTKIKNSPLDELMETRLVASLVYKDESLVELFYENHLDQLLAANNRKWMENQFGGQIDLSASQESAISDLFSSQHKTSRMFAANLAGNIKDTELLRESFSLLSSRSERTTFISSLMQYGKTDQHISLAQELAQESQDPRLRNMATRR